MMAIFRALKYLTFKFNHQITKRLTLLGNRVSRNRSYEKVNFYFFEMLIQNTHFKFKAYIAQTIEKFSS